MTTSVIDYGQLFWRNSSVPGVPLGETLCWKPTFGPQDMTIEDSFNNETFLQLSQVEFAFCGVSYEATLPRENLFGGSMVRAHATGPDGWDASPDGNSITIRIGPIGLDTIMSTLAKYMTKEGLRRNGSDVNGTAYVNDVFVEVKWPWLILPIILVVSGTIFVVMVIIENNKKGTSLWKSSVLAFLYHGLNEDDKEDSMTASIMERKAEGLVVGLQASEDTSNGCLILQEKKDGEIIMESDIQLLNQSLSL